ncbi:MAG: YdbL family protein [Azoarcus sp.]|nr:YdbL family protein [Azoarcus sp.]
MISSRFFHVLFAVLLLGLVSVVSAQGNLDVDTPAIGALKKSMQQRHSELVPLYDSGAVGFARDGTVKLRDASAVPLPQRGRANTLIAAENDDRAALYREIARANDHPEWESDIRSTFAQRFIDRAKAGWWVETQGGWKSK